MEYEIPVAFGVLTEDAFEQAIESAGIQNGQQGRRGC
ncbi:6,7-dimethyl-8-ribityllumazine synthase [Endozoicomonas elysicola]|nr:6,7-dimethyl-8-ribityllumazine synthase [Endozoicomonas elysicola]